MTETKGEDDPRPVLEITEAREQLAERLFLAMERLDPSQDGTRWTDLGADEKEFYRATIKMLESEQGLWSALLRREAC
jgi:hypothetical protein